MNLATGTQGNGGGKTHNGTYSYIARLNYNYAEKYMVELMGRRDGNSKFAPGYRFKSFGSVSLGWAFSEEQFVEFGEHEPKRLTAGDIGVTVVGKVDLSKFERKRTEFVEGMENIYIIDTNVFVKCPDIISKIGSQYKVIIPATVLEELDKLKLKESVDKQALSNAAKNICRAFEQNFSKMEDADTSLLPNGFNASNPDCKILSVALKHKQEGCNPILLTSDNMLRSRAVGLGLKSLTLKEFLGK